MIRGVHTMFYSSEPEALRAFLRDKLGLASYTDVGEGWLIFDLPEADMGVHPSVSGQSRPLFHSWSSLDSLSVFGHRGIGRENEWNKWFESIPASYGE